MNSNFDDNLKPTRSGFTLIELLFVIAIIAVLGSMAAGILGKAKKDAQIASTRSRITQIEAIMQTVMEEQEVRRLPGDLSPFAGTGRQRRSRIRNLNRRVEAALLLAEYPVALVDNNGEFIPNPDLGRLAPPNAAPDPDLGVNFRTWAGNTVGVTFVDFLDDIETAEMAFWKSFVGDADLKEPGEYLYLILNRINIDGISALESLGSNANIVGDPDEDGHPDIVDAFGDSMQLRIVQIAVQETALPATDIWTDVPPEQINWQQYSELSAGGGLVVNMPLGYEFLQPVIPRSMNKIRFQVVSQTLEEIE